MLGVLQFIPNWLLETKLLRFRKMTFSIKMVTLGLKDPKLRYVLSLRRHRFIFLFSSSQTLTLSFGVWHGEGRRLLIKTCVVIEAEAGPSPGAGATDGRQVNVPVTEKTDENSG